MSKQISEAENRVKVGREKQKNVKDVQIDGTKQLKYWRDLLRMMELKQKVATVTIFDYLESILICFSLLISF